MRRALGFSLIELMIAVLSVSIVVAKGLPFLVDYIRNDRIRSAAEEMRDGLHSARMEAIRRNTTVRFVTDHTGWSVVLPGVAGDPDELLLERPARAAENLLTTAASAASVGFNGSGRLNAAGIFTLDIADPNDACAAEGGAARCLRVVVAPGGMIRMCDPALAAGNPQAC
jgi:type IV fimbrial biogenesis protein FimT